MKRDLLLVISCINLVCAADNFTIELYDEARDGTAVTQIIADNPEIQWEVTNGLPAGTSQKMLKYFFHVTEVMRVDGKTIGFINYRMQRGYFLTFFIRPWCYLLTIGIDKEYQHQGYGKAFLQYLIDRAKEKYAYGIILQANVNNSVACHMYEQMGFKVAEIISNFADYNLKIDISADKLPQGNIIQRHPKISLPALVAAVAFAWKNLV